MNAPQANRIRPGIAAALDVVQTSLASAEHALLAGRDVDLEPLEAQIRSLCEETTKVDASARVTASDTLAQVLERLSALEAAIAASARR